jgi:hypothetical protein
MKAPEFAALSRKAMGSAPAATGARIAAHAATASAS